ncbi:hypothetical protein E2C01_069468 [Portunus trituberculatus]|uniref:Uncharacterized protein n=1 Tax=Portunus trituberculatus TaxID=210409 RepID=A0A5B7HYM4_PORTR|nr:hypothetical protein [Portunus trituberculatus]
MCGVAVAPQGTTRSLPSVLRGAGLTSCTNHNRAPGASHDAKSRKVKLSVGVLDKWLIEKT